MPRHLHQGMTLAGGTELGQGVEAGDRSNLRLLEFISSTAGSPGYDASSSLGGRFRPDAKLVAEKPFGAGKQDVAAPPECIQAQSHRIVDLVALGG